MLSEVVHDRLDAPLVRLLRDADRIVHRFPGDPLAGEAQGKTHRSARTPPRTQKKSEKTGGKGGSHRLGAVHAETGELPGQPPPVVGARPDLRPARPPPRPR